MYDCCNCLPAEVHDKYKQKRLFLLIVYICTYLTSINMIVIYCNSCITANVSTVLLLYTLYYVPTKYTIPWLVASVQGVLYRLTQKTRFDYVPEVKMKNIVPTTDHNERDSTVVVHIAHLIVFHTLRCINMANINTDEKPKI